MKSYFTLSPAELARHYVDSKGDPGFLADTAAELVKDVERYLDSHQLQHRQEDAVEIAQEAFQLAREALVQQAPTPTAPAEFMAQVQEGTTASDELQRQADELAFQRMDDLLLAGQVANMSMAEYAANRERLGLHQSFAAFLGGAE